MATDNVVWIVIAALVWVGHNRQVSRRTSQADETAAKARAAQAEAEAARLEENAAKHRDVCNSLRRTRRFAGINSHFLGEMSVWALRRRRAEADR
jgi:hypothetical protein